MCFFACFDGLYFISHRLAAALWPSWWLSQHAYPHGQHFSAFFLRVSTAHDWLWSVRRVAHTRSAFFSLLIGSGLGTLSVTLSLLFNMYTYNLFQLYLTSFFLHILIMYTQHYSQPVIMQLVPFSRIPAQILAQVRQTWVSDRSLSSTVVGRSSSWASICDSNSNHQKTYACN